MELLNLLKKYKFSSRSGLFTTPTHSGIGLGRFAKLCGQKIFKYDFSEIDGFDNIRNPQGIFEKSQKWATDIYGVRESFYLYNGSTSGILALMLATLQENDKIIIPRNCHISVLNGLVLSRAQGVFFEPEYDPDFDVPRPLDVSKIQKTIDENPDVKAVILTNPTYEGVVSNIAPIAELCKSKEIILIVDEAHGALWNFSDKLPESAILQGADGVVQSLHKTAGALTQSSILHLSKTSQIDAKKVQASLNLINSTSPSYLLLASIEGAIEYLSSQKGQKKLEKTLQNILDFRKKISNLENVEILQNGDFTKIFIKIKGLSGYELSENLSRYNIEDELANDCGVLLLTGLGTDLKKLNKLEKAIKKVHHVAMKKCFEDN